MGKIYTVTMLRWGDRSNHSYTLGVFDDLKKAQEQALMEVGYRGGKYTPEILEMEINQSFACGDEYFKEVKSC